MAFTSKTIYYYRTPIGTRCTALWKNNILHILLTFKFIIISSTQVLQTAIYFLVNTLFTLHTDTLLFWIIHYNH